MADLGMSSDVDGHEMLQTSAGSDGPQCYNRITCLEKSRLENMEQVRRHRMLLSLQHVCHLQFCSTPFHVVVSAGAVREHAAGGPRGGGWAGGVDCAARRVRRQLEGQRRLLCVVWPKSREGGVDDGRLRQRRRWRRRRWRRWRRRRRARRPRPAMNHSIALIANPLTVPSTISPQYRPADPPRFWPSSRQRQL